MKSEELKDPESQGSGSFVLYAHVVAKTSAKKPERLGIFHQLGDYGIALMYAGSASQSPQPLLHALLAFVVLVNTATTRGPLCAYSRTPRRVHDSIDLLAVIGAFIAAFIVRSDVAGVVVLGTIAVVHLFIIYTTRVLKRAKHSVA